MANMMAPPPATIVSANQVNASFNKARLSEMSATNPRAKNTPASRKQAKQKRRILLDGGGVSLISQ